MFLYFLFCCALSSFDMLRINSWAVVFEFICLTLCYYYRYLVYARLLLSTSFTENILLMASNEKN